MYRKPRSAFLFCVIIARNAVIEICRAAYFAGELIARVKETKKITRVIHDGVFEHY